MIVSLHAYCMCVTGSTGVTVLFLFRYTSAVANFVLRIFVLRSCCIQGKVVDSWGDTSSENLAHGHPAVNIVCYFCIFHNLLLEKDTNLLLNFFLTTVKVLG